jgi:Leucine-rich repeat (LRR) protein
MGAVSDVLANCQGLTSLDLARNNVRDKGVDKLTAGLRGCPTLKELVLISNNITDEGATSLAGALPLCTALTKLNLSHNDKIRRDGERALRSSIPLDSPLTIELMQRSWLKPAGGVARQ